MKKVLLTLSILTGLGTVANAQHVRFGVKAGATASNARLSNPAFSNLTEKFGVGMYAGALAEISFKSPHDKFKLQVEALYNYSSFKNTATVLGTEYTGNMKVQSISVPVLAKYFFTPSFSLYAGPTANFNLGAKYTTEAGTFSQTRDMNNDLNGFQLGAMVGANYYVWKGLFVEAKYHAVTPDLLYSRNAIGSNYNTINNISLGIGFKFK